MTISVIIPVYNVEGTLQRCVESVLRQTFADWEAILVDDGSTDGSGSICDSFAKKDQRISVIHKENGGLSDARNCGLDVAQGDVVTFIDSDDYISDHTYACNKFFHRDLFDNVRFSKGKYFEDAWTLPLILKSNPLVMTCSEGMYYWDEKGISIDRIYTSSMYEKLSNPNTGLFFQSPRYILSYL